MLQTYSSPTVAPLEPEMSIPGALRRRARTAPDRVIVERHVDGAWQPRTAREFYEEVLDLARGLVAWGLEPGEKVGIMGHTSYEWTLADFAIWSAGGIPVSIYETSSPEQISWIGTDSDLVLVMAESEQLAKRVRQAEVASIRDVQLFGDIPALVGAGVEVEIAEVVRRTEALAGGDLATIIYTSGTTGQPKGVELAHQSFLYLAQNGARSSLHVLLDDPAYRTLLFMPLAHVFARFIEVLCITEAGILGHAPGAKHLVADMQSFKPTFLLAVPRVFEKVFNSAQQSAATGVRKRLFSLATRTAITYSRALDTPAGPSRALKAQHAVAMRLVLNRIREAMGGQLEWAISGGAPLGERLGHFYRGIGVTVLEGYGMTETTAPTTVNVPEHVAIGTVGPAYAGTEIGIADDGEIVVRGPHVFMRYHNNPEATAETFTPEGWLRTGDLGSIDELGRLRITGRRKELIITAGGKNVSPAVLEDRFRGHPLVSNVVVVGDQRPYIGALVTLDEDMLPGWLEGKGLPKMTMAEARHHPVVRDSLARAARRANRAVSRAESIRRIVILEDDFTEHNGYLTPSLKVKRNLVLKDFAGAIDELYAASVDSIEVTPADTTSD